ncbi:MAG: methyltransferase, partial [Gemmatimonadetes bacterium]|nr:methyltransferase [Gemmatimonadota bacterium]
MSGYRRWELSSVGVSGRSYAVASKPGVLAHGRSDPSALLLAERAHVEPGDLVVHLNCGGGLFGSVAANRGGAARVFLSDRNVLAVEAARRTLAANGAEQAEVLIGHGTATLPAGIEADVVAIRAPHEKLALFQLLWDAFGMIRVGGYCYLAGATNEGVKPAARSLERLFGNARVLGHRDGHRVVAAEKRSADPASPDELVSPYLDADVFHEIDATLGGVSLRLFSRPGVFSWDHLDEATAVLADQIRIPPGASVLDLGCGSGGLGTVAGRLSGAGRVCMLDADSEAVRCAARTAAAAGLPDARALVSDVASAVLEE